MLRRLLVQAIDACAAWAPRDPGRDPALDPAIHEAVRRGSPRRLGQSA